MLNEEKIRVEAKSVGEGGVDEGGRERIERGGVKGSGYGRGGEFHITSLPKQSVRVHMQN